MLVVDASIVVRLLSNRRGDDRLRERIAHERRLHAPALIDAEVTSALRGLLISTRATTRLTPARADQMLQDYADLPLHRHPMHGLQRRVLDLRHNLTAYDAFYVVLAEALQAPLLTGDGKFARTPDLPVTVETWPTV